MIILQKKPAFTLIELIIVITIIGVLAGVLVFDFVGAKRQQELSSLADQAVAILQQTQAEVSAGKVRIEELTDEEEEDGVEEEAIYLCLGAYFEVDSGFQAMTADYDYDMGVCDVENAIFEDYGVNTGEAFVGEIEVDGVQLDSLMVYFIPPMGLVEFDSGAYEGDALITLSHSGMEDKNIYLSVDSVTNRSSISNESPDENENSDEDEGMAIDSDYETTENSLTKNSIYE